MPQHKQKRYTEFTKASNKIGALMEQCKELFGVKDDCEAWHAYLEYVDEIIINGLLRSCASSIGCLLDETDSSLTQGILFEIKLELQEPDIVFNPPIDKAICNNFYDQASDTESHNKTHLA